METLVTSSRRSRCRMTLQRFRLTAHVEDYSNVAVEIESVCHPCHILALRRIPFSELDGDGHIRRAVSIYDEEV